MGAAQSNGAATDISSNSIKSSSNLDDREIKHLDNFIGRCDAFKAEDALDKRRASATKDGKDPNREFVIYRQDECPDWVMVAIHIPLGDYYGHVPIKRTADKKFYVDTLADKIFDDLLTLIGAQIDKGDPDGLPFKMG